MNLKYKIQIKLQIYIIIFFGIFFLSPGLNARVHVLSPYEMGITESISVSFDEDLAPWGTEYTPHRSPYLTNAPDGTPWLVTEGYLPGYGWCAIIGYGDPPYSNWNIWLFIYSPSERIKDPTIAVTQNRVCVAVVEAPAGASLDTLWVYSAPINDPTGGVWSTFPPQSVSSLGQPDLEAGDGETVYIVFRQGDVGIVFYRSSDGGQTWGAEWSDIVNTGHRPRLWWNGGTTLYMVYSENPSYPFLLYCRKSTDNGNNWSGNLLPYTTTQSLGQAVIAAYGNTVLILADSIGYGWAGRAIYSTNGGSSWTKYSIYGGTWYWLTCDAGCFLAARNSLYPGHGIYYKWSFDPSQFGGSWTDVGNAQNYVTYDRVSVCGYPGYPAYGLVAWTDTRTGDTVCYVDGEPEPAVAEKTVNFSGEYSPSYRFLTSFDFLRNAHNVAIYHLSGRKIRKYDKCGTGIYFINFQSKNERVRKKYKIIIIK